ncbi:MAG: ACP S-malonyltransferase [Sphingomonadaceae bacterium]|nr:ACP S-malonyltransferase [Sphingomonadaceae bacterium]
MADDVIRVAGRDDHCLSAHIGLSAAALRQEPRLTRAFVFPGQGSQQAGMGKALHAASPAARAVFEEVDDALGQSLSRLMFDGDLATLTLTENAQPAIMAVSIATLRVLQEGGVRLADRAAFVAGHSLGEYSALCAAGVLTLADTARLLRARGRAMQAAVPVGVGAMAVLIGLDLDTVQAVADAAAEDGQVCAVANDNAPGQVVVSGHEQAVARAITLAKAKGSRHSVLLPVSAPFHCPLMAPAAEAMATALADTPLSAPFVPLVANVTAAPVIDAATIRRLLVEQVTGRVRWRESVLAMVDAGVDRFVELGAKVLSPMVKRITPDAGAEAAMDMATIEAVARGM